MRATVLLLVGLLLALTACEDISAHGSLAAPPVPTVPRFKGSVPELPPDSTLDHCSIGFGEVEASGRVRNTSPGPRDFAISVSWVETQTSRVIARGVVLLRHVGRDRRRSWRVHALLAQPNGVRCVLTEQRGTAS